MIKHTLLFAAAIALSGCSIFGSKAPVPQPLPPVKVITETVQLEIYQPPLPQEINMRDVTWHVLTNTPCKPATGENKNPKYYTTQTYQTEEYTKEDGTTSTRAVRDEEGNRIPLPVLVDEHGDEIMVCGNLEQKIAEVEKEIGGDFVLMGISVKGYENMAFNLQEIKRYINQQKEIILYYREATSINKSEDKEGWAERNKADQAEQLEEAAESNAQEPVQQSQPMPTVEPKSLFDRFNPF